MGSLNLDATEDILAFLDEGSPRPLEKQPCERLRPFRSTCAENFFAVTPRDEVKERNMNFLNKILSGTIIPQV